MILYSTTLQVKETLDKDTFIQLVIDWNRRSPYAQNVIPNIEWNGEKNIRYGNDRLWLDIEEYRNRNIIAVRFEKMEADGAIWDTDYVMDYNDRKLTIVLDRSYTEDALMEELKFGTPHFITMLIEGGYVADDVDLPVLHAPTLIGRDNVEVLARVVNGQSEYKLPVVYVSKTFVNRDPIDVRWLCSRLKGAAHVLLEKDVNMNTSIRTACHDNNEYAGGIGIYLPNGRHKRFLYRTYEESENILLNKVVNYVLQYMNAQKKPKLATWQGVNNELLMDRYETQKAKKEQAESEMQSYINEFDDNDSKLRQQIEALTRANSSLQSEIQGLRAKLNGTSNLPVLYFGDEEEFYPGEIREMLLDTVTDALKNLKDGTRRYDVLLDILQNNDYRNEREKRAAIVRKCLIDCSRLSGVEKQELMDLGFDVKVDSHIHLTYGGDSRYYITIAKSGSDHRGGLNNISVVVNKTM